MLRTVKYAVGGPYDYEEFLEAIADPKHERHAELLEWLGSKFDLEEFDVNEQSLSGAS